MAYRLEFLTNIGRVKDTTYFSYLFKEAQLLYTYFVLQFGKKFRHINLLTKIYFRQITHLISLELSYRSWKPKINQSLFYSDMKPENKLFTLISYILFRNLGQSPDLVLEH